MRFLAVYTSGVRQATSQKQRDALRWCAGFRKSWSVSNMAVMNAVYALMLFSDHINI